MGRKAQKNDSLPGSLDMLIVRTLSRRDLHEYPFVPEGERQIIQEQVRLGRAPRSPTVEFPEAERTFDLMLEVYRECN
jgi:hypothetical protein